MNIYSIFTPQELTDSGCVYLPCITFIHKWKDPFNPILKSYTSKNDNDEHPMYVKSYMCSPSYIKNYDFDKGTKRGIRSINDYHRKKKFLNL